VSTTGLGRTARRSGCPCCGRRTPSGCKPSHQQSLHGLPPGCGDPAGGPGEPCSGFRTPVPLGRARDTPSCAASSVVEPPPPLLPEHALHVLPQHTLRRWREDRPRGLSRAIEMLSRRRISTNETGLGTSSALRASRLLLAWSSFSRIKRVAAPKSAAPGSGPRDRRRWGFSLRCCSSWVCAFTTRCARRTNRGLVRPRVDACAPRHAHVAALGDGWMAQPRGEAREMSVGCRRARRLQTAG
jgi:hypothetical protein